MKFNLTIFDCDGTLVDSEYLNNLALVRIMAEEGLPQYDMDYAMVHFVGQRLTRIINDITRDTGHIFPPTMSDRYVAGTLALMPEYLKPIKDVEQLVRAAAACGPICVASNGQREGVVKSLEMTNLKKYFADEHIFTAVEVPNGKPAPDLFLHAARKMGVTPSRCVVIEDSIPGVTAGAAAGMHVIGFAHDAPGYAESLKKAGAHAVFDSLIHIKNEICC